MADASGKTFLEFTGGLGGNVLNLIGRSLDIRFWRNTSEGVFVWRQGKPGEQEYDFNPFFPTQDGRSEVDRLEGYLFATYEHRGGTGEFTPYPAPDDDEDDS